MPFDTFKKSVHFFKAYFSFIEIGCIEVVLNEVGGDTMERSFKRIRIVVVQPDEQVYFDRYYTDPLVAMDKFNYFCQLAKINYPQEVEFAMERTALYNEMTAYFPYNEINPSNQSGFVQVSMYFEVDRLQVVDL